MREQRVLFVDFRDSFSHNLIGLLRLCFRDVALIDYAVLNQVAPKDFDLIVLGPGPGHFSDYSQACLEVRRLRGHVYLLGVCLGHQILGSLYGLSCSRLSSPLHGRSMVLRNMASLLGVKDLKAQFYNSWAINLVEDKPRGILMIEDLGFVVAFFSQGVGAVQFHPESVGTSCPKLVLDKVLDVLYNGHYDLENGRCIRSTHY